MKAGLSLIKNELIPLWLTTTASAADAGIHEKKVLGSGVTALIKLNEEMEYLVNIVKSLDNFGLVIKGVTQTIKPEEEEQSGEFLCMLLGTLGTWLLRNMLAGKGATGTSKGQGFIQAGNEVIWAEDGPTWRERGTIREGRIFNIS